MKFSASLLCVVAAALWGCGEPSGRVGAEPDPVDGEVLALEVPAAGSLITEVSFDATEIGQSAARSVVLVHRGRGTTAPLAVTLSGSMPGDFAVAGSSTCPGARLASGERCRLDLEFRPADIGDRAATLEVSAARGGRLTIALRGEATRAADQLALAIAGGGLGEVVVRDAASQSELAVCTADCTVAVTAGQELEIAASTVSRYGGLSGACVSQEATCTFTAAAGTSTLTATFARDPGERWTVLPGGGTIRTAAYDSAGNLVVGTGGITKLSPDGAVVWNVPLAVCVLAIGPGDTIYAQTTTQVVKLDAGGATLWSRPLDRHAVGCGDGEGFIHNLAVGVDGAVAIHGDTGVARWDADGNLTWAAAVDGFGVYGVAIDRAGTVHAGVLDPDSGESIAVVLFAADGTPLGAGDRITPQYHGMFLIDAADRLVATASGHSHTDFVGGGTSGTVEIPDPDYAPTGICSSGGGELGWLYQLDDGSSLARDWVLERYRNGQFVSRVSRAPVPDLFAGPFGTVPMDIAMDAQGNIAIVGSYTGVVSGGGWIQTFGP
jgi:hypothetical protein